jgi:hypothetical protein
MLNKIKTLWSKTPWGVAVVDGVAVATDLRTFVVFPHEAPDGVHDGVNLSLGVQVDPRPLNDFPDIPEVVPLETVQATLDLRWNILASSTDEDRPHISAVQIGSTIDTTDGHRLHRSPGPLEEPMLISRAAAVLVDKLFRGKPTTITRGETWHSFEFDGVLLLTKEVDGRFPPVEKVIPQSFKGSFTLEELDLRHACKVAKANGWKTPQGHHVPPLQIYIRDEELFGWIEWAEGRYDLPSIPVPGDEDMPLRRVSALYLEEAVRHWSKEPIEVSWNEPHDALKVRQCDRFAIVMPVRT